MFPSTLPRPDTLPQERVGLYKPDYNRLFVNEELLKDPREFLGTLRHEGWHVVQDCMGGGIKTSFMAQVHQDSEIPAWIMKATRLTLWKSMRQSLVLFPGKQMLIQQKRTTKCNSKTLRDVCYRTTLGSDKTHSNDDGMVDWLWMDETTRRFVSILSK
jgi:hypothetical protein